jgi:hypothetical protein
MSLNAMTAHIAIPWYPRVPIIQIYLSLREYAIIT